MNVVKFEDEARRLNVPLEFVKQNFEKAVSEGKIHGVVNIEKGEIICFKLEEITDLENKLSKGKVSLGSLAVDLNLEFNQTRQVINYLMTENKVKGVLVSGGTFVSDEALRELVFDSVLKSNKVNMKEISGELLVPETKIKAVFEEIDDKIIAAVAPYEQIKVGDLANEVGLQRGVILILLKQLTFEGKISGRLDMVRDVLVLGAGAAGTNLKNKTEFNYNRAENMRVCPTCNHDIDDDKAEFCPRCGTKLTKELRVIETTNLPRIGAVVMLFGFIIYVAAFMSLSNPYSLASYEFIFALAFIFLASSAVLAWARKDFKLTMVLVFVALIMEYFAGINYYAYTLLTMLGFFVTLIGVIVVASARQEFS